MSSLGNKHVELRLRPKDWDEGPESQRYPLSLMGHTMPKIYVAVTEVFALPEGINTEATTQSMAAGLEFAISQFPILAGVLAMDAATGRMWVVRKRDSAITLHVKHLLREGEFPSYEELEAKDVRYEISPT